MIRSVLTTLRSGVLHLRNHTELWFVIAIGLALPALFLVLVTTVLTTAQSNQATLEKARVSSFHASVSTVVGAYENNSNVPLEKLLNNVVETEDDVMAIGVFRLTDEGADPVTGSGEDWAALDAVRVPYRVALTEPGKTFYFDLRTGNERTVVAYLVFKSATHDDYLLYTKHSFAALDALMLERHMLVYSVFGVVLILLLLLAYWASRQIDYRARFVEAAAQHKEHALFLSTMVHELRTPLTAIRGYASLIKEDRTTSSTVQKQAMTIVESAGRLVGLIGDFLSVARMERGLDSKACSILDILPIVDAVVHELAPQAHDKHLTLGRTTTATSLMIQGDPKLCRQILVNLISNAIKYTPQGHVEVLLTDEVHAVELRIKDTGMGMSADDQTQLFAPFSRVGGKATEAITGTGLGMWITKRMVEGQGGTIGVESIKGVGTHVVVRFNKPPK